MPRESTSRADAAPRSNKACVPLRSFLRTHWIIAESSGTTLKVLISGEIAGSPIVLDDPTRIPRVRSIARGMNDMVIWCSEWIPSSPIGLLVPSLTLTTIYPMGVRT